IAVSAGGVSPGADDGSAEGAAAPPEAASSAGWSLHAASASSAAARIHCLPIFNLPIHFPCCPASIGRAVVVLHRISACVQRKHGRGGEREGGEEEHQERVLAPAGGGDARG